MVVILDLGDGLDDQEQRAYDACVEQLSCDPDVAHIWKAIDPVPAGCKPLPRAVVAWVQRIDMHGSDPMLLVEPPTTPEAIQEYFALDPERVAERCFSVFARDVLKHSTHGGHGLYDPTPTFDVARRRIDALLTTTP